MKKTFIFIASVSLLLTPMVSMAGSKPVLVNKPKGDRCAKETKFCRYTGTGKYDVYFGARNRWMKSTHSNSKGVYCNSNVLGKHLRGLDGVAKTCYISKSVPYAEQRKQDIKRKERQEKAEAERKAIAERKSRKERKAQRRKEGARRNNNTTRDYGQALEELKAEQTSAQRAPESRHDRHANQDQTRVDVYVHHDRHDDHYDRSHLAEYEEKAAAAESRGQHRRALQYYRKAAKTGDANAQFRLGNLYYDGYGSNVNHSRPKALAWWESAARQGHHGAQYKVGDYYERHNDVQTALGWYQQAVDQHDPDAQARLGYMYLTGQGVSVNTQLGLDYLHHSAEQGNAEGCYLLGVAYISGRAGSKNLDTAAHWFLKAAEQNHPHAPYQLGIVYEEASNYREAIHWYGTAARLGNKDAMNDIHRLNDQRDYEDTRRNAERHRNQGGNFRN